MAKYCSACGAENRDTARFCQMCAYSLTEDSSGVFCGRCGRSNPRDARFCQGCGAPLTGSAAQPAPFASVPLSSPTGMLSSNATLNGRYIIASRIGQGGMGAVYKAFDRPERRLVAIKELSESSAATQAERDEARAGFRREAEMLARLAHRNLPRVYDFFEDSGKQYLVMDFVNGETVESVLKRSPSGLPVDDVLRVADQLCDVLDYLHTRKKPVIFRDLKPGNIMIDDHGGVKLIDFGIARHFASGKTSDTVALGTMGFAPPEQYGKGQTDPRSDTYALGATLHALLTGIDPANNPFTFVPPRSVRPAVPVEVDRAIMKAVEKDPKDRWQTARAMKQALHALSEKPRPQPVRLYTPPKPAVVPVSGPAAQPASTRRPPAAAPPPVQKSTPAPAQPAESHVAPVRFWSAVFLGALIGAAVLFGLEVWGWVPQPTDFLQTSAWAGIFWFTGALAYMIARRPVAVSAAWLVEPLWNYSDRLGQLALPVLLGLLLGGLMKIGGSRVTYDKLLVATGVTMLTQQIALMYFYSIPFRWEEVAGALVGASLAYVVGWAFRR